MFYKVFIIMVKTTFKFIIRLNEEFLIVAKFDMEEPKNLSIDVFAPFLVILHLSYRFFAHIVTVLQTLFLTTL